MVLSASLFATAAAYGQPANDTTPSVVDVENIAALNADDLFEHSFLEKAGSPIDFDEPLIFFLGLPASLLALFWAMRTTAAKPEEIEFGAMFIIEQLAPTNAVANKADLVAKIVFSAAVTGMVTAAAGPKFTSAPSFPEEGAVHITIDNGPGNAHGWETVVDNTREIIGYAYEDKRDVIFTYLAPGEDGKVFTTEPMNAALAVSELEKMQPVSWGVDLQAALENINGMNSEISATFYMSDGLQHELTYEFAQALNEQGPLSVYDNKDKSTLMMPAQIVNGQYQLSAKRADTKAESFTLTGFAGTQAVGSEQLVFEDGQREASILFSPIKHGVNINDITAFRLAEESAVNTTVLVSGNNKPRSIGIATKNKQLKNENFDFESLSLNTEMPYLIAALEPIAKIHFGTIAELIGSGNISNLIIPDEMHISEDDAKIVHDWVQQKGGAQFRFAGPNLARDAHINDPLLPLDLLKGAAPVQQDRASGEPALEIAEFPNTSPFYGVEIQKPDPNISKILIPDPAYRLREENIWAKLTDNTPLVVTATLGNGRIVYFNTSANLSYSDFPFYDGFPVLLAKSIQESNSIEQTENYTLPDLPPMFVLNARGQEVAPSENVQPLTQAILNDLVIGPLTQPGMYGNSLLEVPVNLSDGITTVEPLGTLPENVERKYYSMERPKENQDYLWLAAAAFLLVGGVWMSAHHSNGRRNEKIPTAHSDNTPELNA